MKLHMSKKNRTFAVILNKYIIMNIKKFLTELLCLIAYTGLFYVITTPIFDFIASNYVNRFELAWSISLLLAIFNEKLNEIREILSKTTKKDE